ncbi:serine/threonine protein kinase [Striga asiatica]|uniref:Serine/threonine protein kinase n=1 Tax=Striga asiatica TaxID=4170 RepID=A0A5A7QI26_STRAF|nr:serine/threonine protein kinase [Striga asiatica]
MGMRLHLAPHISQPLQLGQHHPVEIRPIPPPQLTAPERQPGKTQRLLNRPLVNSRIQHIPKPPLLNGGPHQVSQPHGRPSRDQLQQQHTERVHGRCSRRFRQLPCGGVGRGDEAGQPDVADLGDVVSVEEDVCGLEVAVDEGLRFCLVEEVEGCCHLSCDAESGGPREGGCAEETVFEGSVVHVLVDEAAVLGAGAQEDDHVRVTHSAQYLHLHTLILKRTTYLLLELFVPFRYIRPQHLNRDWRVIDHAFVNGPITAFADLVRGREVVCGSLNFLYGVAPAPHPTAGQGIHCLLLLLGLMLELALSPLSLLRLELSYVLGPVSYVNSSFALALLPLHHG